MNENNGYPCTPELVRNDICDRKCRGGFPCIRSNPHQPIEDMTCICKEIIRCEECKVLPEQYLSRYALAGPPTK